MLWDQDGSTVSYFIAYNRYALMRDRQTGLPLWWRYCADWNDKFFLVDEEIPFQWEQDSDDSTQDTAEETTKKGKKDAALKAAEKTE